MMKKTHNKDKADVVVIVDDDDDAMVECPLCQDSYPADLIQQHIDVAHAEKPPQKGARDGGAFAPTKRMFNSFSFPSTSSSSSSSSNSANSSSSSTSSSSSHIAVLNDPKKPKVASEGEGDEKDYANCANHSFIKQHRVTAQLIGQNTNAPYYKSMVLEHYFGLDSESRITDVMSRLRPLFESHARKSGATVLLCSELNYYCSGLGDNGWGCGYRNIQMMASCLLHVPPYSERMFGGCNYVPGIGTIQKCIESSWEKGFDAEGQQQLRGKVLGTSKFIGSSEGCALLRSYGIPANLVDLHAPTGEKNQHPALFNWVWSYFENASNQNVTIGDSGKRFVPPLYFQHQGHSRTIIGIERKKNGSYSLLILDPGSNITKMRNAIENDNPTMFKRTIKQVTHSQYQLIAIGRKATTPSFFGKSSTCFVLQQPLLMEQTEYQESKKLTSLRLA